MAVAFYEVGRATAASTDTIVIPVTADVPRSDPALGGTLIYVFYQVPFSGFVGGVSSVVDDAPVDDAYSLCIFADGLNHYTFGAQLFGLIINPLLSGVNNITLTLTGAADFIAAIAIAITGANVDVLNTQGVPPTWLYDGDPSSPLIISQSIVGATGSSPFPGAIFTGFMGGTVQMVSPPGTVTDENWSWLTASDYAFYVASDVSSSVDELGWTWADGSIADYTQWDIDTSLGGSHDFWSMAFGVQTAPTPLAAGPSFDGAWGNAGDKTFTAVGGFAVAAGPGPTCSILPPPGGGVPIFNNHIRLSE